VNGPRVVSPRYRLDGVVEPEPERVSSPAYLPGRGREDREILPCEEWLRSRYYSGRLADQFWREDTRREFCEIVDDPSVEEVILDGSIGWGKTFFARAYLLRLIYEVSCLANPGEFFLGNPTSVLTIAMMSVKLEKSREVVFDKLRAMLDEIAYFQTEARFNDTWDTKRLLTSIRFADFGLHVRPVVTNIGSVISEDLFGFVLDEANFLPRIRGSRRALDSELGSRANGAIWSAAREYAKKARTRIRSRFLKDGRCWGKMLVLSSAIDDEDFTEERRRTAEEAGDLGTRVRYVSRALWEGKPVGTFGPGRFTLDLGSKGRPPRVLPDGEAPDGETIEVPSELRVDFDEDPILATRELAGRRSAPRNLWLSDPILLDSLWDLARRSPCDPVQVSGLVEVDRHALVRRGATGWEPIHHPDAFRVAHVDLSSTGDSTGVVVACSPGMLRAEIRDRETGGIVEVPIPRLHVDFTISVVPPRGGRISIEEIEDLLLGLVAMGFDLRLVTFDGYQSERSMEAFTTAGIPSRRLSVDRYTDPYSTLRRVLRLHAMSAPYSPVAEQELTHLVEEAGTGKVDHPPRGSKDVADGLAAVSFAYVGDSFVKWATFQAGGVSPIPSIPL